MTEEPRDDDRRRICAIVPSFNARETLPEVLHGIDGAVETIIVVDDGSSDATPTFLREWSAEGGAASARDQVRASRRVALLRPANGGKAAALRDGFEHAIGIGFELALTIDADGQHDPIDARRMVARAIDALVNGGPGAPPRLLCGARDPATPGYPRRNLTGRRLNDLAIRAQTGVPVDDSPCGLRVYPLIVVSRVRCLSGRFAWEEEFITRAIWMGAEYESQSIRCIYHHGAARRSHYRFRRDWPEGFAINLWLLALASLPPAPTRAAMVRLGGQVAEAWSLRRGRDQLLGDSPARLHGGAAMALGALGAIGIAGEVSAGSVGSGLGPGSTVAALIAAWLVIRWHGSLWLAGVGAAVGIGAGALAGAIAQALSDRTLQGELAAGRSWVFAGAALAAALLLLGVTWTAALRRKSR